MAAVSAAGRGYNFSISANDSNLTTDDDFNDQIDQAISKLNSIPTLLNRVQEGKKISTNIGERISALIERNEFQQAVDLSEKLNSEPFMSLLALRVKPLEIQRNLVQTLIQNEEIFLAKSVFENMIASDKKDHACQDIVKYYCQQSDIDNAEIYASKISNDVIHRIAYQCIVEKCCELNQISRAMQNKNRINGISEQKRAEEIIQEYLKGKAEKKITSWVRSDNFQRAIDFVDNLDDNLYSLETCAKLRLELVTELVKKGQTDDAHSVILQMPVTDPSPSIWRHNITNYTGCAYLALMKYLCSQRKSDEVESLANEIPSTIENRQRIVNEIYSRWMHRK